MLGTLKDILSNGRVIMIGFWTYFDNKRMFGYLNRYQEGERLQKPFADVITKAAISSQLFKDPAGALTRELPLSRPALSQLR